MNQRRLGESPRSRRRTPEDWIEGAVEALLDEGPSGLRVTRLAKRLGVSPGSFYWHFRDRDQFRTQLLQHWRDTMLRSAAAAAERAGEGRAKLEALPHILVARRLPTFDRAMRLWAAEDPIVAEAVARADELRVRVVTGLLEAAGVDRERAGLRARAMMWAFRGALDVEPDERMRVMAELLGDVISARSSD